MLELAIVGVACYYLSFGSFMWIWAIVGYLLLGGNLLNLTILLISFGGLILISFVIVIPNGMTSVLILVTGFIWFGNFVGIFNVWLLSILLLLLVL